MSSSHRPFAASAAALDDDDDEWQSMPVETAQKASAPIPVKALYNPHDLPYGDEDEDDSDPDDPRRFRSLPSRVSARNAPNRTASGTHPKRAGARSQYLTDNVASSSTGPSSRNAASNATGKQLDIDDARGYNWRSKPAANATADSDDESDDEKGYSQLRLDEDEEADQLHAATEYLFQDGSRHDPYGDSAAATPLNQMNTTKQLLTDGQKIAYVGLCSLIATEMVRQIRRVPGKTLEPSKQSMDSWSVKIMARLYQHMAIEGSEQRMIESLAEHGVLATDLAPSLITTRTIENPDFDPEALKEKQEEEQEERLQRQQEETRQQEHDEDLRCATPAADPEPISDKSPTQTSEPEETRHKQEASSDEDEDDSADDGDLGLSRRKPSEPAARDEPRLSTDGTRQHSLDDEGFDIGMQLEDSDEEGHPTTSKQGDNDATQGSGYGSSSASRPNSISSATTVIADPNTAAQISNAVDAVNGTATVPETEAGPGSVTTTLGLTREPQALEPPPGALDGVTTSISSADATITLDLRWTVLCDLFLVLTADSVYDARSRVLLERMASYLGLTWMDVTQFEKRITDALEIQEGVESLSDQSAIETRMLMARKKRMVLMGLATVGGGLVIGLSAGLLAPVIGAGMGAALGAVGIGGTTSFLGGVGGAALITSTGTVGGMSLAGRGMSRRTRSVKTFEFKPIHNNKRVNAIVTVPGFMSGPLDDVRLPFSVIDSVMGDVFSVLWEPDMMQEMGNALGLLWNETIVQGVQQALALTVAGAGAMLSALAWPLWLTKLGYLIDNPWSNALDRAKAAGLILADTLSKRQLGVRPITLVGYSLGARVIFYALVELARIKAYGIVQNVYIMGAPVTAKDETWKEARSVVSGRFVSAFNRNDWILGYLHRAASGGLRSIAGLHPVERVQDIENVDVTHVVPGHLGYRPLMPLVLGELGFRTTADYFDEPEDLNAIPERQVVREEEQKELELKSVSTKTGGFGKIFRRKGAATSSSDATPVRSNTPSGAAPQPAAASSRVEYDEYEDDDLPPREEHSAKPAVEATAAAQVKEAKQVQDEIVKQSVSRVEAVRASHEGNGRAATPEADRPSSTSAHFDTEAILRELRDSGIEVKELQSSLPPLPLSARTQQKAASEVPEPASAGIQKHETVGRNPATDALPVPPAAESSNPISSRPWAPVTEAPAAAPHQGISLTFASHDDEDIQPAETGPDPTQYGLSPSAAKELAARFGNGDLSAVSRPSPSVELGQRRPTIADPWAENPW